MSDPIVPKGDEPVIAVDPVNDTVALVAADLKSIDDNSIARDEQIAEHVNAEFAAIKIADIEHKKNVNEQFAALTAKDASQQAQIDKLNATFSNQEDFEAAYLAKVEWINSQDRNADGEIDGFVTIRTELAEHKQRLGAADTKIAGAISRLDQKDISDALVAGKVQTLEGLVEGLKSTQLLLSQTQQQLSATLTNITRRVDEHDADIAALHKRIDELTFPDQVRTDAEIAAIATTVANGVTSDEFGRLAGYLSARSVSLKLDKVFTAAEEADVPNEAAAAAPV